MPYLDASRADLQRSHGLTDANLPDAAILFGVWSTRGKLEQLRERHPDSREVMERTALVFDITTDERQRMRQARDTLVQAALVTAAQASSIGAIDR